MQFFLFFSFFFLKFFFLGGGYEFGLEKALGFSFVRISKAIFNFLIFYVIK